MRCPTTGKRCDDYSFQHDRYRGGDVRLCSHPLNLDICVIPRVCPRPPTFSEDKPPIGLRPELIHNRLRALEILKAMGRYVMVDRPIPLEWFSELRELCGDE